MTHLFSLYLLGILITFIIPSILANILLLYPPSITTQIGSSVTFRCFEPASQSRGVAFFQNGGKLVWKVDGNVIMSSSILNGRTFVESGIANGRNKYSSYVTAQETHSGTTLSFTLQINNISINDSKRYSCALLSNENVLEVESQFVKLLVHFPPNRLHPLCTVDSIRSDSSHATLKCRSETAVPPVDLKWISSRSSVNSVNSVRYSKPKRFSEADLEIPITNLSGANFTCVMNYTGDFEQSIRNCTLYTPKITLDPTYQEVVEGNDAEFKCNVSAEPKPTKDVQWSSFPTLKATNFANQVSKSISILTLRNVSLENNGTQIMCGSQNTIGEMQGMAYLLVKTPSKLILETSILMRVIVTPRITAVHVGETAVVECQAIINKTSSISTPELEYMWYYEDKEISASEASEKFSIEKFPFQRLYVSNVDIRENNATITCIVNAGESQKRAHARLIVSQQSSQIHSGPVQNDPKHLSDIWKIIIPVSAGLVSLTLIVVMFIIFYKANRKCSVSKNQHRVHDINDSVRYNTSLGVVTHPFNNDSHTYCTSPKIDNHERLMVNLPPIPPIPEPSPSDKQNMETWKAAKKLEELQEYEDMETVRSNLYHMHENIEYNNEYQSVIHRLDRTNSLQNTQVDGKMGMPEPLY